MSDLWDRCRELLRTQLRADDWKRSIQTLRARLDADVLYLWVERGDEDWRSLANPARDFDQEIREAFRQVCGRVVGDVQFLDRPPNREHVINQRRIPEHRRRMAARQDQTQALLLRYAKEECLRMLDDPPRLPTCRNDRERCVRLEAMAMDRAKRRLVRERPQCTKP